MPVKFWAMFKEKKKLARSFKFKKPVHKASLNSVHFQITVVQLCSKTERTLLEISAPKFPNIPYRSILSVMYNVAEAILGSLHRPTKSLRPHSYNLP